MGGCQLEFLFICFSQNNFCYSRLSYFHMNLAFFLLFYKECHWNFKTYYIECVDFYISIYFLSMYGCLYKHLKYIVIHEQGISSFFACLFQYQVIILIIEIFSSSPKYLIFVLCVPIVKIIYFLFIEFFINTSKCY